MQSGTCGACNVPPGISKCSSPPVFHADETLRYALLQHTRRSRTASFGIPQKSIRGVVHHDLTASLLQVCMELCHHAHIPRKAISGQTFPADTCGLRLNDFAQL